MKKRVLANLTPAEQAALIRRAKANRRSAAEEAGSIIAAALAVEPAVLN